MSRSIPRVAVRGASLTLWLTGALLSGISCRANDIAEPTSSGGAAEAGLALATTAAWMEAEALDPQSVSFLAPSNTWVAKRPLPKSRTEHSAATLNKIIYVVGGRTGIPTVTVLAYDAASNTWSSRKSLPIPLLGPNGVSAIGDRLYVTGGGTTNAGTNKTLLVYKSATNTWVQKAGMPEPGSCGAQGVIAGLLYVYTACPTSQFFQYNPASDTWITLAPPPTSHTYAASGAIGGKFYLAGGGPTGGGISHNQLDVYDPATNTWTTGAPMLAPAMFGATATLKGQLFVAGGSHLGVDLATLSVYNPTANTWTAKAPMPTPRTFGAAAAAGGLFFVIGGRRNGLRTHNVLAYTP